jgi:hypothetical protein
MKVILLSVVLSLLMPPNVFQAGAGGFMKNHVSTRTKLTYEDTCFLAEAKTKKRPDDAKRGGL